ncbi:Acg family FMN-binding oxidoreductase [Allokutzneria oryzae]|uniref:Acg family FMN-binding oxidoreductase n=1 Tax=Allokutzneria oryzae TaxID=1378989 RepID=A0ABV6A5C8_9PSEU
MSSWSYDETQTLIRAVQRAPSVHNTQPWSLELSGRDALLFERRDIALPYDDPTGRDRLLSCGGALANLRLAVRKLGWRSSVSLLGDPLMPDWVGTVTATGRLPTSSTEHAMFAAIPRRRSYRLPFTGEPVSEYALRAIVAEAGDEGVGTHLINGTDQVHAVAGLVEHATNVFRLNRYYQRELLGWITHRGTRRVHPALPQDLVGPRSRLSRLGAPAPDREVIAEHIAKESVLVVFTENDGRREHLLAGAALERAWLAATALGLAASVVTQPLHLAEVRGGLAGWLELPGRPHALLRIGRAARVQPTAPRKAPYDIAQPRCLEVFP